MQCQRCKGRVVQEEVVTSEGNASMLRCLYCGELIDQVVMANRTIQRFPKMAAAPGLMKYSRN